MQTVSATPYVYPRKSPVVRATEVDLDVVYEAEFGGLDRDVHAQAEKELELLVAPGLPAILSMLGFAIVVVLGTLSAVLPGLSPFTDDGKLTKMVELLPIVLLGASYLLGVTWLVRWTFSQRYPLAALPFGVVALSSGALASAFALATLPVWALVPGFYLYRSVFLVIWTSTRSLLSRDYSLARVAAYERQETTVLLDAFTYDEKGWGLIGKAIAVEIWFVRKVTRPFIRPSYV